MDGIDVTSTQYTVLLAASERDGLSQQDIINATGISLTDAGRDVLHRSAPIISKIEQTLVGALPATRAKTFISNLRAIVAAFEPAKA